MKIPQSIKQLKRKDLEEICFKQMYNNHKIVHERNRFEDRYDTAINVITELPLDMPCDYDEKWYGKHGAWCEEHCDEACECEYRICWEKYIEDRMCENERHK